eukprot:m.37072 g.37072  ORF g.37072 m.37072 type:complete len:571 (+) comp11072_c1_seq2:531-2243(+)
MSDQGSRFMSGLSRLKGAAAAKLDTFKEIASDKLRGDDRKYSGLRPETQAVDDEVSELRGSCQMLQKHVSTAHPYDEDRERLLKKVPLHHLGTKMMASADSMSATTPFKTALRKCGRIQNDLGQLQANYYSDIHNDVVGALGGNLKIFQPVTQARKQMQAAHSEVEATQRSRAASTTTRKPGQAVEEEDEAAHAQRDLCEDKLMEALLAVVGRDRDLMQPLVDMLGHQLEYHKRAAELIERAMPSVTELSQHAGSRRAFGCPLAENGVDSVVRACAAVINRDGLDAQGIFRLAGSASKVRKLRAGFNSGTLDLTTREGYFLDIHAIASIFKIYLRELPEPLLMFDYYDEWLNAARVADHETRLFAMQSLLKQLPRGHFETLRFISRFLFNVCQHGEENKMKPSNMGIVIGPNLLWHSDPERESMSVADSALKSQLCELFITYHEWLFPPEDGEIDAFSTTIPKLETRGGPASSVSPAPARRPPPPSHNPKAKSVAASQSSLAPPSRPRADSSSSSSPTAGAVDNATEVSRPVPPSRPSRTPKQLSPDGGSQKPTSKPPPPHKPGHLADPK